MRWMLVAVLVAGCGGGDVCKDAVALTADECGRTDVTCYRCETAKLDANGLPLDWFQCDDGRDFRSTSSSRESLEWVQAYCAEEPIDPNAGCEIDLEDLCMCDDMISDPSRCE